MVMTAESVQERGVSAGMTETAAARVETVGAVRREKRDRPEADDRTNFQSVHKRTKKSRAVLNNGMGMVCPVTSWKLEALHGLAHAASPVAPPALALGVTGKVEPAWLPSGRATAGMATPMVGGNLSFSTNDVEEDSDDMVERGKGTSEGGDGVGGGKMVRFFEGLTKQAMERQDAMQQRFVEAIEKREQGRMIREEAWRREGMARLAREQEILARERAMSATRGAAVLSFVQKITRQTVPMPSIAAPAITFMPPSSQNHATPIDYAAPPPPSWQPPACARPQPSPRPPKMAPATPQPQQNEALVPHQVRSFMTPSETPCDRPGGGGRGRASSSPRWTKTELHALIQLRSNLLGRRSIVVWEEISAGMRRMGYSRSSKQCREKWNNMDKYFKKLKQSNKNSKTCSYFHHLDALYRIKAALEVDYPSGVAALPPLAAVHSNAAPQDRMEPFTVAVPISQRAPPPVAKNDVRLYDGRYMTQITEPGRPSPQQLGIFDNVEEAAGAYELRPHGAAAAKTNFEQPPMGNGEESSMDLLNDLLVW